MSPVSELAALARWAGVNIPRYDWVAIERCLGFSIPGDYKDLLAVFPRGMFFGLIQVVGPRVWDGEVDLLGEFRIVLDNMRETREAGNRSFPYPIYPEAGGLIIWGNGRNAEHFFWLMDSEDPDEWSVVVANAGWTKWDKVSGPMTRFLLDVGSRRSQIDFLPVADVERPAFIPWPYQ